MYIYFDTNGTIKEVINDESIRRGSSDYNKIYCYLEGNPDIDDIWYLQKNPDGTLTNEVSFVDNIVTKAIPYDAKRDMKYFQDFEEYQFYVFTLSSSYLSQNGLVVATIRVAENNTLWALGEITFNVEENVIKDDNGITQSQYDYLLLAYASRTLNATTGQELDDLIEQKVEANVGTRVEEVFEPFKEDMEEDWNNYKEEVDDKVNNVIYSTNSTTIYVGENETYTTINDALAYAKYLHTTLDGNITIMLRSGFVIEEQIFVKNNDMGYITISSEDAEVYCDASNFSYKVQESAYGGGYAVSTKGLFVGYGNAVLPNINILVNMNNTGDIGQTDGVFLIYGAKCIVCRGKGIKNSKGTGISLYEGSSAICVETIFSGNYGNNISCFRNCYLDMRCTSLLNSQTGYGIYIDGNCIVDGAHAVITGNNKSGVWVSQQSSFTGNRAVISNNLQDGLRIDNNSMVDIEHANVENNGASNNAINCKSSKVVAIYSTLTGGTNTVASTEGSFVNLTHATISGASSYSVYANFSSVIILNYATSQKVIGTADNSNRVGYGGIIYAYYATAGYSGASENECSINGIVLTENAGKIQNGFYGTTTNMTYFSTVNNVVYGNSITLEKANEKTITLTQVKKIGNSALSDLSVIQIVKSANGFYLKTSDATAMTYLSGYSAEVTYTVS